MFFPCAVARVTRLAPGNLPISFSFSRKAVLRGFLDSPLFLFFLFPYLNQFKMLQTSWIMQYVYRVDFLQSSRLPWKIRTAEQETKKGSPPGAGWGKLHSSPRSGPESPSSYPPPISGVTARGRVWHISSFLILCLVQLTRLKRISINILISLGRDDSQRAEGMTGRPRWAVTTGSRVGATARGSFPPPPRPPPPTPPQPPTQKADRGPPEAFPP